MSIRSTQDLDGLREVGRIVGLALRKMKDHVRAGLTTAEIDRIGEEVLERNGARSAPRLVYNFPGTSCISVNEEIVHGIPSSRLIGAGDLVKLDLVAEKDGYMADAAITVAVAPVSEIKRKLIACAERAFARAMRVAHAGKPIFDIGRVIEGEITRAGFSVIRELSGHGIGRTIHEEPNIPNFYDPRWKKRLTRGLVIAVEPMVAAGSERVTQAEDGWTIKTSDGSLAAHFEHTIVITAGAPIVLTA